MKKNPLLNEGSFYRGWVVFRSFLRKAGINPLTFLLPSLLSFLTALADGISIGLLIPTIQGLMGRSFAFVYHQPVLKQLASILPGDPSKNNGKIFTMLIILIFVFALAKNLLSYLASVLTLFQVREFGNKSRKLIYGRYLGFGKMFFDRAGSGHLHQILVGYTQQISQELALLQSSLVSFFSLVMYSVIAFAISWKLTLFSAIVFPILHYSTMVLIRRIERSSESFAKTYSEMGMKISNALSCITLVKAYSNEAKERQWFNFTSDKVRDFQFAIDKKQAIFEPFREIVGLCIILLLVGFMAFLLIHEKAGNLASFMVFFIVLRRASSGFGVFASVRSTLAGIWGPVQEIRSIMSDQNKFYVPEGTKVFTGLQNRIEFKGLNFGYLPGRQILTRLDLTIKKNETLALVGSTGSGKTTLVNLLMRFYDVSPGTLFIDGTDIREFTSASLREKMALVSQDTLLFNAPLKVNITYGLNREVTDEELHYVLERSRLSPLIKLIGLDAQIGDRGVKLSGGERQRLSIARALLKKPEILILDEATSALDSVTEGLVHAALSEIVTGKTVIVIAHRLATVRNSDRIVVLDKGKIVEEGSFHDLLAKKEGRFYYYWQNQMLDNEN